MTSIKPLSLCISPRTDIFSYIPADINKRKLNIFFFCKCNLRLVEQDEQVPIGVGPSITASSRTVEVNRTTLWQYIGSHLLDLFDYL